jgi:CubicO group peptidase (beta-lactamase class C family)
VSLSDLRFVNPHRPRGADPGAAYATVAAAPDPHPLPVAPVDFDVTVVGAGTTMSLEEFLAATYTTSLLVVVDGRVVLERYADGVGPTDLLLGASMSKSVLATLVGLEVATGSMSLQDKVTDHVPELAGSGYDGTRVLDVITMTTGVDWVEDHRDPQSLASRLAAGLIDATGGTRELLQTVRPHYAPGSRYEYCTADSQVLDWIRERAGGVDCASATSGLWAILGAESGAVLGCDAPLAQGGVAFAGGALAATARDWARVGILQIDGTWQGRRVLDPAWVDASSAPPYPFLQPGRLPSTLTTHAGFGYHWWPLDHAGRRVTADGSRGQFTYVDRDLRTVVVKTSQWPYDDFVADRQYRDLCYLALPEIARRAAAACAADIRPRAGEAGRGR